MRAQIKVPLIQGCLLYAHKTDITSKYNNGKTPAPDPLKTLSKLVTRVPVLTNSDALSCT